MSIVIGCDSFLSLRNVRNGELGQRLRDHRVLVWVDPHQFDGSRMAQVEGVELGCLEDFNACQDRQLARLVMRTYFARKCYYDPATMWADFRYSSHRHNHRNYLRRGASVTRAAFKLARHWAAGQLGWAQHWSQQLSKKLRSHSIADLYRRRLQEAGAACVASFSPEGFREIALVEAANALDLPTVVLIRSRDNLSSKIRHLPNADLYLVWSDVTRTFLQYMYPEINPGRIMVTGSPQFDHHLNPACRMDRERFFSLMGLDTARPLIVFTMSCPGLVGHEIDIVQHLADAAHAGKFVRRAQLLVRGHPRMFGSDAKLLHREYPEARCYPRPTNAAYRGTEHEAEVVRLILEEEPIHLATLAYQDVQVNLCGTMTIDSAIFDKPTVNVYYDLVKGISSGMSVRRFYERSDVKQMMAYGASRLASDPDECIRLINRYLDDPTLDVEGRKRARQQDCGPLDGKAGMRIANHLNRLARHKTSCVTH